MDLPPGAAVIVEPVAHPAGSGEVGRFAHFHDVCELVLFGPVAGRFVSRGQDLPLGAGAVVFVPSMQQHDFVLAPGAKRWTLVQVDPYIVERLAQQPACARLLQPFVARPDASCAARLTCLADWLAAVIADDPHDAMAVRLVELILIAVATTPDCTSTTPGAHDNPADRLLPALERLRRNPAAPLSLAEAASACHLSPGYFARRFRQVFAMSFAHYARTYRLHLAARQLATGRMAIAEIAYAAGFASPSHFAARFAERFALSPSDYRARAQHRKATTPPPQ